MPAGKRPLRARAASRSLALALFSALSATGSIGLARAQAEAVFTPLSLPTISGKAAEGEVLTETHARWSAPPASYTLQWQRCDAKGNSCQSISKATGSSYRVMAADVGSTIRVSENARNAAGAVTPVLSEPTAVVRGRESGGRGGGEQGGSGGGGGGGSSSQPGSPSHPSSAELERLLARQLRPSGRAASLAALRHHGGSSMRFTLPQAGALTVKWYLVAPGPKRGKVKHKPTLLAEGHATLTASKAIAVKLRLTARGGQLLRHARKLRVEARATFAVKSGATVAATAVFALHV